jgi:hypothetical protein
MLLVDFMVMGMYISVYPYACHILPLRSVLITVKAYGPMCSTKQKQKEKEEIKAA